MLHEKSDENDVFLIRTALVKSMKDIVNVSLSNRLSSSLCRVSQEHPIKNRIVHSSTEFLSLSDGTWPRRKNRFVKEEYCDY